jgi:hypothetical protein
MAVSLKWKGDELYLGKTMMAHVRPSERLQRSFEYVLGPEDKVSTPYQDKDDARQDCLAVVRDLLAKAGA